MTEEKKKPSPLEEALVHLIKQTAEERGSIEDEKQEILRQYDAMECAPEDAAVRYFDCVLRERKAAEPLTTFIDAVKECQKKGGE